LVFEASLRAHLNGGRNPGAMLADYDKRWSKAERRETAYSAFAAGRLMAERFLALDARSAAPLMSLQKPGERVVLNHLVRLNHDLVYGTESGLVLRQLLTDSDLRRSEHLRLYAVASLLHFEAAGAPLAAVEVWQLRFRKQFTWPRFLLLRLQSSLALQLDLVARAFEQDAA
jgi:hypothetical protein